MDHRSPGRRVFGAARFAHAGALAATRRPSARVGMCSEDAATEEVMGRLQRYINGFMNDPSLDGRPGYPPSRASWPGVDGTPTDAWNSPLAHRYFYEWQVAASGGRTATGAPCMDVAALRNLLSAIGMDLTYCGADVASKIAHAMDKGGDDDCVAWPEYLNSIFAVGPASDAGSPDPTEPGGPASGARAKVSMRDVSAYLDRPPPKVSLRDVSARLNARGAGGAGGAGGGSGAGSIALPIVGGAVVLGAIAWAVLS